MKSVNKLVSLATVALLMSSAVVRAEDAAEPQAPAAPAQPAFDWQSKENGLLDLQKELNQKWAALRVEQTQKAIKDRENKILDYEHQLEEYRKQGEDMSRQWQKLSIKQQLSGILDAFKDQGSEIWGKETEQPQNITLHVDTVNSLVGVFSDELDVKGRPVSQWELNRDSGLIIKTRRAKDGSEVHVTEKEIDIDSLLNHNVPKLVNTNDQKSVIPQKEENQWQDTLAYSFDDEFSLEQQRDMAFKIMEFMIGFIIVTFGLLFVFFRMTQSNQEEIQNQKANNEKANRNRDSAFIDFLSGRMDYDYIVKPTEDMRQVQRLDRTNASQMASEKNLIGQIESRAIKTRQVADHRVNSGFGGNNLEHLSNEERGRFDDIDLEGTRNDFSLLANFSKN